MKKAEMDRLVQFDTYSGKLPTYATLFSLTAAQTTATRNDYLWAKYAFDYTKRLETEWGSAVNWKTQLNSGPAGITQTLPSIGSQVQPPAGSPPADGILSRWRTQVDGIKSQAGKYTVAIGDDLDIEATLDPVQQMKPTFKLTAEPAGVVVIKVLKDGHGATTMFCQRGSNPVSEKLGTYTKATITDSRPNLVPGTPEKRTYTARYEDADQPVGEMSDACSISTQA